MGERKKDALRVNFDSKSKLKFDGVKITSDAGLLTFRDRFDILMEIRLNGVAKRSNGKCQIDIYYSSR